MKASDVYRRSLLHNVLVRGMSTVGFAKMINDPLPAGSVKADPSEVLRDFVLFSTELKLRSRTVSRQYGRVIWWWDQVV